MAAFPSAPFVVLCACSWLFVLCEEKQVKVKSVQPGDDVTLQCRGPGGADITLIEWTRADLKSDKYVFFYPQNPSNENFQLPSFHGRVKLTDPEVRDASVVLKNVTFSDAGTYECRVKERNTRRTKRNALKLIKTINLTVKDSDSGLPGGHEERGHSGLMTALSGFAVAVVVAVVGLVTFRNRRRSEPPSYQPADDVMTVALDKSLC